VLEGCRDSQEPNQGIVQLNECVHGRKVFWEFMYLVKFCF
jgi:hypothetical protein